ncbi:nucleotidyltransferase [Staphylococcus schweitzeri]|uniref:tRNA(Met) cytidine acetate ligase n=1 Tax=Staphylococcus schweitzeri TaxID=1654388 RepID=A0A2K4AL63_9STAP|nr:nucleotidyltransferase [Staphylococcus schweitzeri]MBE2128798.1 nucleotidyltransferase [Staphylococcus schweitzeri]PNZ50826.1 nucleotidyltransferase [Staphylococcus schweitzeri]CDR52188.1 UPF0348 protein NWMN_0989 [Staphylococcus schweitzeri]CDR54608.1 UPF0348 protein NWMN_0989 [Staphylococcus schweitzeri]CDR61197.1 UPF0348 protein NWMN_0989 [Staphylococcus schweitzeri]
MKSVGLITEYNPFHNGHQYHINQSKNLTNADVTIAIMSGNFVMRGEPAIYNKFTRAKMALTTADLVIELPTTASLSSGDYFAETAIKVANYLNVDTVAFGSENNHIETLKVLAQNIIEIEESTAFSQKLKEGKSYPRTISELLNNHEALLSPNNLLGISYLKAIAKHATNINAISIKRESAQHHDASIQHHEFASGTSIRTSLINQDDQWHKVVPTKVHHLYSKPHLTLNQVFPYLKYQILAMTHESLKDIYTVTEGLENRLKAYVNDAKDFHQYVQLLKTKRYTYTHIQRVLMNILLNTQLTDVTKDIEAVKVLAMNDRGRQYLKHLKTEFPNRQYFTNINKNNAHYFKNEIKATQIYNAISGQQQTDFNTPVIQQYH